MNERDGNGAYPLQTISGGAPYGAGGLGQHLAQVVEEARSAGRLRQYFALGIKPGDESVGQRIQLRGQRALMRHTPLRLHKGWRDHVQGVWFDRAVARRLPKATAGEALVGFVGKALYSFRRARALGFGELALHVGNSHVEQTLRLHAEAARRYPGIEPSWLGEPQRRKALQEYAAADVIFANSAYTRASFLAAGFPEAKVRGYKLRPHPRFRPPATRPNDGKFRVVYAGALTVYKGVPDLLEAFSRLPDPEAVLTLVGGWSSPGMRKYLQRWCQRDPRIRISPGDPLPHFQAADVYVHPTYEDGFGYAPCEALACGIPVIATDETGMKEHIREGENGYLVPAGDWPAILDRLEQVWKQRS